MLLLLPPMAVASAIDVKCFNGEWLFDTRKSDNPDRLLKKIQRKQKIQKQVLNRPRIGVSDQLEDLSLPDIPEFVFLTGNIKIAAVDDTVTLQQQGLQRNLDTRGSTASLSLKSLSRYSDTMVAGWENGSLVIETTVTTGSRVKEVYSLLEPDTLHVYIIIKHVFEERETTLEKVYRRHRDVAGLPVCDRLSS